MTPTDADRDAAVDIAHAIGLSAEDFTSGAGEKMLPILARHRTASTAALTAENQRLREAVKPFAHYAYTFDVEDECADCPDHYPISRASDREEPTIGHCRAARAALSTTSEVSEPVADESGGEGVAVTAKQSAALDKAFLASIDDLTPPNTINNATRTGMCEPNEGHELEARVREQVAAHFAGVAVREALVATQALLERIDHHNSINFREVRERIVANRATLAKPGGAEG